MLSIGKLGASQGQLEYYEEQVAAGAEEYYSGRGEVAGRWIGSGAAAIGLPIGSPVCRDGFMALTRGLHPADGSVLRRMGDRSTVAAIDLTFSAPKSVSVLYAIADEGMPAALLEAHERAVASALAYLEREACWTRRGHGGAERVRGEGFVGAAYRHRLSRAGDPQLHTHVVLGNLTRADGRFTALDAMSLFEHKSAAGAVYRAVLRAEVRERLPWVSWKLVGRGLFEIDGVPQEVLRHFSQRRVEIEQRARELVGAGESVSRAGMQTITLATRRSKTAVGREWREDPRAQAADHGLGATELRKLTSLPARELVRRRRSEVVARLSGPDGLTGNHNTFARRHAIAELAGEFPDGLPLARLEQAADDYLADPTVRELSPTPDGTARFTTEGLLSAERRILAITETGRTAGLAVLPVATVDVALADSILNEEQAAAVRALATGGERVATVQALAGTGKTTMLRTLHDLYLTAGYHVVGAAPTARAARGLRDLAGVDASTLHALAARLHAGHEFQPESVLLIDEAGMAPTRLTARILDHADRAGAKVIAVGDAGQLTSVEAGGWFAALTTTQPSASLQAVLRQRDPAERTALAALHDGDAETYLEAKADAIVLHATEPDAVAAAVARWTRLRADHGPKRVVMIARDNATREQLNAAARAQLIREEALGSRRVLLGGREWAVGDRVVVRRNSRALDIDNGALGTITAIARGDRRIRIRLDDGQTRLLDATYVSHHLEHAYAITGHASQGATFEAAVVIGRPEEFTREWAYTALSRARAGTDLHIISVADGNDESRSTYAPAPPMREPPEVLCALIRSMGRSPAEALASHDVIQADQSGNANSAQRACPSGWARRTASVYRVLANQMESGLER